MTMRGRSVFSILLHRREPVPPGSVSDKHHRARQGATLEDIDVVYDNVGACKTLSDIGLDEDMLDKVLKCAPLVRNRLTLLRVLAM